MKLVLQSLSYSQAITAEVGELMFNAKSNIDQGVEYGYWVFGVNRLLFGIAKSIIDLQICCSKTSNIYYRNQC